MPFYDDFEIKESVEDYARRLELLRRFKKGDLERLVEQSEVLLPFVQCLIALPERTEEEEEMLTRLLDTLKKLHDSTLIIRSTVEERLLLNSLRFLDHLKELAAGGDAEAQRAYDKLKPLAGEEPLMN